MSSSLAQGGIGTTRRERRRDRAVQRGYVRAVPKDTRRHNWSSSSSACEGSDVSDSRATPQNRGVNCSPTTLVLEQVISDISSDDLDLLHFRFFNLVFGGFEEDATADGSDRTFSAFRGISMEAELSEEEVDEIIEVFLNKVVDAEQVHDFLEDHVENRVSAVASSEEVGSSLDGGALSSAAAGVVLHGKEGGFDEQVHDFNEDLVEYRLSAVASSGEAGSSLDDSALSSAAAGVILHGKEDGLQSQVVSQRWADVCHVGGSTSSAVAGALVDAASSLQHSFAGSCDESVHEQAGILHDEVGTVMPRARWHLLEGGLWKKHTEVALMTWADVCDSEGTEDGDSDFLLHDFEAGQLVGKIDDDIASLHDISKALAEESAKEFCSGTSDTARSEVGSGCNGKVVVQDITGSSVTGSAVDVVSSAEELHGNEELATVKDSALDCRHGKQVHERELHEENYLSHPMEETDLHEQLHDDDFPLAEDSAVSLDVAPAELSACGDGSLHVHGSFEEALHVHDNKMHDYNLHEDSSQKQGFVYSIIERGAWIECTSINTIHCMAQFTLQGIYQQASSNVWKERAKLWCDNAALWKDRAQKERKKAHQLEISLDNLLDNVVANVEETYKTLGIPCTFDGLMDSQVDDVFDVLLERCSELRGQHESFKEQCDRLKTLNTSFIKQLQGLRKVNDQSACSSYGETVLNSTKFEHDAQKPGKNQQKTRRGRKKNRDGEGKKENDSCAESPSGAHIGCTESSSSAPLTYDGPLGPENLKPEWHNTTLPTPDQLNLQQNSCDDFPGDSLFATERIDPDLMFAFECLAFGFGRSDADNLK